MKKVLVTGGAGFIGSNTVSALLKKGYEVKVLDNLALRVHPEQTVTLPDDVEFVRADMNDRAALLSLMKEVDAVIHLAAYQDYMTDFSHFFTTNSAGTALLYELIVEQRLDIQKIVVASTQAVYGEGLYACPQHGTFWGSRSIPQLESADWEVRCPVCQDPSFYVPLEEKDAKPSTPYGLSKHAAEQFSIAMGKKYDIPTVCLRYSLVQGPGQSIYNAYSGIGRIFNQQLMNGIPPQIFEDGKQIRDFVHVYDVAAANILALESAEASGNIYNVGGEKPTTVIEYAEKLASLYGTSLTQNQTGLFRLGDARHTFSNSDALLSIGWIRTRGLADIIEDAKRWFNSLETVDMYTAATQEMLTHGVLRTIK